MTDKIKPALTAEQWKKSRAEREEARGENGLVECPLCLEPTDVGSLVAFGPAAIAIANDALPDSDKRKFTRQQVETLRQVATALQARHENWFAAIDVTDLADALESYLPPE